MAKKQNNNKALEDKLISLKKKKEILENRGWLKAAVRTAIFIAQIEKELSPSPAKKTATEKN